MTDRCERCGQEYEPKTARSKCCSRKCSKQRSRARMRAAKRGLLVEEIPAALAPGARVMAEPCSRYPYAKGRAVKLVGPPELRSVLVHLDCGVKYEFPIEHVDVIEEIQ